MPTSEPLPSTAPSPEFQRHHAVDAPRIDATAFRPGWRVRTKIDKLLIAGEISVSEWRAALQLRGMLERAFGAQLRAPDLEQPIGQVGVSDRTAGIVNKLDVVARLRDLEHALGTGTFDLLQRALVDDLPWCQLARPMRCDPKTAKTRVVAAVKQLAALR